MVVSLGALVFLVGCLCLEHVFCYISVAPDVRVTMLDFMDYIQVAFADATNWNRDNSYSSLTATAQCMSCRAALYSDIVDVQF